MKLIDDWGRVLRKAWSVRLALLSGLLGGLEGVLPLFTDALPRGMFAALSVVVAIGATVARLVLQKDVHGKR